MAREAVERMAELFDTGDLAGSVECFADDAVFVNPLLKLNGKAEIRGMFDAFSTAFPDLRHDMTGGVEDGENVALELVVSGTHTGPLPVPTGDVIPATGRSVRYVASAFANVRDGKIVEFRSYWDAATFMQQLGLVPEPAAATA